MFRYNWEDKSENYSVTYLGALQITCTSGREYKDGSKQFMVYLRVPWAHSKEIITLTKVRGCLKDAKLEAEDILRLREV